MPGPVRRPDSRRGLAEIRKRQREAEYAALGFEMGKKTETLARRSRDRREEARRRFERAGLDTAEVAAALERARAERRRCHLAKKYGMSLAEYDQLYFLHGGACAICGKHEALCVDHCHATGMIRGLLCRGCNVSLGLLGDSVDTLRSAIEYLAKAQAEAGNGITRATQEPYQQARASGDQAASA